jgi:N-acetylneuraminic acid mutarotase
VFNFNVENSNKISGAFWYNNANGMTSGLIDEKPISRYVWVHVAAVWNNGNARIYRNGVLVVNKTVGDSDLNGPTNTIFAIGNTPGYNQYAFNGIIDDVRVSNISRNFDMRTNASLLSPILNISAFSRILIQGDFPEGTNHTIDILDPTTNNTTLQKGLQNGAELNLSLWAGRETPYRELVMRLNVNISDVNVMPVLKKWGVGTDVSLIGNEDDVNGLEIGIGDEMRLTHCEKDIWRQRASGPPARWYHSAVWDPDNKQMLVFGGWDGTKYLNDLWAYIPASYAWVQKASGSIARSGASAVWDPDNKQMLMFGGVSGPGTWLNDIWAYSPKNNSWNQKASGSTIREGSSAVWDPGNKQMLVCGGFSNGITYNDLWAYSPSNNTWTQKTSGNMARRLSSAVWDPYNRQMLVFGGWNGAILLNDLWAYSPSSDKWTQKSSGSTARDAQSAVLDLDNKQMVVFGGYSGSVLNDLWAYSISNDTWTQKATGSTARYGHTVVWDPDNKQMLIFGGYSSSALNDLWANWFLYRSSGSIVVNATPFLHAYGNLFVNATTPPNTGYWVNVTDESNNTLLSYLKNGDPILVNASNYTKIRLNLTLGTNDGNVTPVVHEWGYGFVIILPINKQSCLLRLPYMPVCLIPSWFQSTPPNTSVSNRLCLSPDNITWSDWVNLTSNNTYSPTDFTKWGPYLQYSLALNSTDMNVTGRGVLFGGQNNLNAFGDTWLYDVVTNKWKNPSPSPSPSARDMHSMAYDSVAHKMVIFGGAKLNSNVNSETWLYDVSTNTWTNPNPVSKPSYRWGHSMAYDVAHGKVVLFGGVDAVGPNAETWIYDTATNTWTNMNPSSAPRARYYSAMAYDSVTGKIVLFGGADDTMAFNDTWLYDIATNTWTNQSPSSSPTPRDMHSMAYDSVAHKMVIFGGAKLNSNVNSETWLYDVATNTWTNPNPSPKPSYRWGHVMAFDASQGKVVLFGGVDAVGPNAETWIYDTATNTWTNMNPPSSPNARYYSALAYDSTAPVFRDFRVDCTARLLNGTLTSGIIASTPDGVVISARPAINGWIPPGAALDIYISADNGTTWQKFLNNTPANFTVPGRQLCWKSSFIGDGNSTPLLNGLIIYYTTEHFPSEVSIDVGCDGTTEWYHAGWLDSTVSASNLTDELYTYITAHRTEAVDGNLVVPLRITSSTGGIVALSDAAVDFAPAPRVVIHEPTGAGVPLNASILVGFSVEMNEGSLAVAVKPPVNLTATWSPDRRNTTLAHSGLQENTTYNVTVRAGALSAEGAPLLEDYSWNFTTEKIVDSPKIVDWAPKGDRTSTKPTIMVSFDREMNSSSVYDALSLNPPEGVVFHSQFNTTYNFTVASELLQNTTYTVTVSTTARSHAGTPLASPKTWTFTTIPLGGKDSDLPTVRFTEPPDGAIGVERNRTVSVVFSEAMNKTSTPGSFNISPAVNGTLSWQDNKGIVLQYRVAEGFPNGSYTIKLYSSKAVDESGNPLDGNGNGVADGAADDFSFTFSVWAPAPKLLSYSPTGTRINLTEPVVLTFDRKMNLSSVKAAISIDPAVDGEWTANTEGNVITFTPRGRYRPGTTYSLTLGGIAKDEEGVQMGIAVPWTFKTTPAAITEKSEFPWWILLLVIICAVAVGAVYYKLKKARPQKAEPEGAAMAVTEAPPEAVPVTEETEKAAAPLPEAPVIPLGTAPPGFAVEDIFLMYRDGRLIQHTTRRMKADMDVEIMTSMLKAVQDFVRESVGLAEGAELGSMEYGENKIIMEKGRHIILAAVITGEEPDGFREEMRGAIRNVEGEYEAILKDWDGTVSRLAGAKKFMTSLGAYRPAGAAPAVTGKADVLLMGELEFYQGFVRMKVAVKNNMPTVIRDAALKLVFNETALRLDHVEPEYRMEGKDLLLKDIEPGEKKTVAFYLDPQICTESHLEGVLTYKDAHGNLETSKLQRKLASVVCPVIYTDENINTAMLKRMAAEELEKKDTKVFSIPPSMTPQRAFDVAKSAVQHHDVRLVREFTERDPFTGEAWYFGKAKGRADRLVIRARVLGDKNLLEFFVASSSTLMLTGMLAELKVDLNKELDAVKGRPVMRQVTAPEQVDALAQIRTLLDMEAEAESAAGETETSR